MKVNIMRPKQQWSYPAFSTLLLLLALAGSGQGFSVTYEFTGVSTSSGRIDPTPPPAATGIQFGNFQATGPANTLSANPNAGGRFSFTGWPLGATNGSDVFTGTLNTEEYYEVTLTPQANYQLTLDSISFTLQRSATGIRQYAIRSSLDNFQANLPAVVDPANINLSVVPSNIFQVLDASTTAQTGSKVTLAGFGNLSSPVSFRFYGWNAEASGGTFSIDNVKFTGSTQVVSGAPVITPDTSSLRFPVASINTSSAAVLYTVRGEALTDSLRITTSAPFSIAESENGTYDTTLTFSAADAAAVKTIFVKFSPTAAGSFIGSITHSSNGAASKIITLSGEAFDPANLIFNFNNCLIGSSPGLGFVSYSVTGTQQWACSNFGLNNTRGVDVNGYLAGAQENEDWLISSPLLISSLNIPVLRFWSRGEFTGPSLQLLISTDYDGSGNPNDATWTNLEANFPPSTNIWTLTDGIILSGYKSSPKIFIAFKYTSSVEFGAARWTLDNIEITDRSTLLTANPSVLNFNEILPGTNSAALPLNVQAIGYGDLVLRVPEAYEISADSLAYSNSLVLPSALAESGTRVFVRYSPVTKVLRQTGTININGTGLDSNAVTVTGTSYPRSETFDVAAYNLSFFGSTAENNPTPQKIETQITNIAAVLSRLNMDVVGFEEMSSDSALNELLSRFPGHSSVTSPRWSYSFTPPDPNFPPQKIGFIYNSSTATLVDSRVMFEAMYDSARTGLSNRLDNYPEGTPSSFWASGRLPFMATFDVNINGILKRVRMIDIHAKSASDAASYNRRVYDVKVLKDTLDVYYPNDNIILVGDFNDRVTGSIFAGGVSPYNRFVIDPANYEALTLPLDQAGRVSFLTGTGLIDHIIISNELRNTNITNSTDIEDPRTYISNYNAATASDHLPVYTRFNFNQDVLPVTITHFEAKQTGSRVLASWTTAMEVNNRVFLLERSVDGKTFSTIARVGAAGSGNSITNYQRVDSFPLPGMNFYRLKQVDLDGKEMLSEIVPVRFVTETRKDMYIYPNPVTGLFRINLNSSSAIYTARVTRSDGGLQLVTKGNISQVNGQINALLPKLKAGIYILQLVNETEHRSLKFVKQ